MTDQDPDHVHQPSSKYPPVPRWNGARLWLSSVCACGALINQPAVLSQWEKNPRSEESGHPYKLLAQAGGRVCHDGPVTEGCPVECLAAYMETRTWLVLARGTRTGSAPRTVDDVLKLYSADELKDIDGLGPARLNHVIGALTATGLELPALTRQNPHLRVIPPEPGSPE